MDTRPLVSRIAVLSLALSMCGVAGRAAIEVRGSSGSVDFAVGSDYEHAVLTVALPDGRVLERSFSRGEAPSLDLAASGSSDGAYAWRLEIFPGATASRNGAAGAVAPGVPSWSEAGSFAVVAGAVVSDGDEPGTAAGPSAMTGQLSGDGGVLQPEDFVINDDLIVTGSACVGFDCVNGEVFGFDTLRLKENNLRIGFDDTSNSAAFPRNDWELMANDSANGGLDRFSIRDVTGGRIPFTIRAAAPDNSIFVTGAGRIGLGTSTPVLQLHEVSGNTPSLRLDQNGSAGFMPQVWDIAGNEASFFVRDATNGSTLPFRIRPGAPTSSIDINSTGVGIGTASPSEKLHVRGTAGTTKVLVEEASASNVPREMLEMQNNGLVALVFKDNSVAERWSNSASNAFIINNQANAGNEFRLNNIGNLTIAGMLTQGSSRDIKRDISPVDPSSILERVALLPVSTWRYRADESGALHVGPMAQDFRAAFGLGEDDETLAPSDLAGVSLAAIQALRRDVEGRDAEIEDLKQQNEDLARRLAILEERIRELAGR